MGWIKPRRVEDDSKGRYYDLWTNEDSSILARHKMHLPAPKIPLPGHHESYNPPPEYMFTDEEVCHRVSSAGFWLENRTLGLNTPSCFSSVSVLTCLQRALWEQQDPIDRKLPFIPKKYPSLRQVPAFSRFIHERFERCLDLYLCPRQRKMRVTFLSLPTCRWSCPVGVLFYDFLFFCVQVNVNPEDLIPKLPKPKDLQPFPTTQSLVN